MTSRVSIIRTGPDNHSRAETYSNFIKHGIERIIKDPAWVEHASSTVYELVRNTDERLLKRAALHLFSSNSSAAIEKMKKLKILVDGYCPVCGEPTEMGFDETRAATNDLPREGIEYSRCTSCGWNDYKS